MESKQQPSNQSVLADLGAKNLSAGLYYWESITPSTSFVNVIFFVNSVIFITNIKKKSFDEGRMIEIHDALIKYIFSPRGMEILICDCGGELNKLMMVPPSGHHFFQYDRPNLHDRTYVLFPFVEFEFPKNPSVAEVEFLRERGLIDTSNWARIPEPIVYFSFFDSATGSRSASKKPKLARFEDAVKVIRMISENPRADSFMKIETWDHRFFEYQSTENGLIRVKMNDSFADIAIEEAIGNLRKAV